MNLLINTVMQEKQRIVFRIEKYEETLRDLPKGSLSSRLIGNRTYYYLKYRKDGKVISKYIPYDLVGEIRSGIEKRKHTESMLSSLKQEKELADKILGGAV